MKKWVIHQGMIVKQAECIRATYADDSDDTLPSYHYVCTILGRVYTGFTIKLYNSELDAWMQLYTDQKMRTSACEMAIRRLGGKPLGVQPDYYMGDDGLPYKNGEEVEVETLIEDINKLHQRKV